MLGFDFTLMMAGCWMDKQFHMSEYCIFVFSEMFIKPNWTCFQQKENVAFLFFFLSSPYCLIPQLKLKSYPKTTLPIMLLCVFGEDAVCVVFQQGVLFPNTKMSNLWTVYIFLGNIRLVSTVRMVMGWTGNYATHWHPTGSVSPRHGYQFTNNEWFGLFCIF